MHLTTILFLIIFCLVIYLCVLLVKISKMRKVINIRNSYISNADRTIEILTAQKEDLEKQRYANLDIFKLQPVNSDYKLVTFRYEKYLLEKFDSKCFLDGVKISRSAMLRIIVDNFVATSKPIN